MPGPSPAPVGNHLVLDADVREGAAYHDVMIDTAGREGVEVLRRHALVDQVLPCRRGRRDGAHGRDVVGRRSEEHTSELQSLMRISYAVFCLKKKNRRNNND